MITQSSLVIHEWIILCKFSLVIEWPSSSHCVGRLMDYEQLSRERKLGPGTMGLCSRDKSLWDLTCIYDVNFRFLSLVGSQLYSLMQVSPLLPRLGCNDISFLSPILYPIVYFINILLQSLN